MQIIHTGSEAYPVACTFGTKGPFPSIKLPEQEAENSLHLVQMIRMSGTLLLLTIHSSQNIGIFH